jgi:hypothetical protein
MRTAAAESGVAGIDMAASRRCAYFAIAQRQRPGIENMDSCSIRMAFVDAQATDGENQQQRNDFEREVCRMSNASHVVPVAGWLMI